MEQLIPVINELQWIFKSTGAEEIRLPQIVVVGSQSSGKSSVLESLVGQSFLPRGAEIVTKCPIILQLIKEEEYEENEQTWKFIFDHEPATEYTDMGKVQQVLERRMAELTDNKGISKTPIIVRIRSPNVIPLTVIDLPGIVKLRMLDQPVDIEKQVHDLVMEYIKNPSALILAVSPANADIATSESIKLAKEVDPKEERTIAVITKLDLMDKGTDATRLLSGNSIKVKHLVGVVNRSQQDINDNVPAERARQKEDDFLNKNYPSFKNRIGSAFLAKILNQLLVEHIQTSLPDLTKHIQDMLYKHQITLDQLGSVVEETEKQSVLEECVNNFFQDFKNCTKEGKLAINILHNADQWSKKIRMFNINANGNINSEIEEALNKSTNFEGFASIKKAFKIVAKNKIQELHPLARDEARAIHKQLRTAVELSLIGGKWLKLNALILSTAKNVLGKQLSQTQKIIEEHLEVQRCMVYSLDPRFRNITKEFEKRPGTWMEKEEEWTEEEIEDANNNRSTTPILCATIGAVANPPKAARIKSPSDQTRSRHVAVVPITPSEINMPRSIDYCKRLITKYCCIIQKEMGDFLPKQCFYFLYKKSVGLIKLEINKQVAGKHADFISESENAAMKRKYTEEMMEKLQKAQDVIDRLCYSVDFSDVLKSA